MGELFFAHLSAYKIISASDKGVEPTKVIAISKSGFLSPLVSPDKMPALYRRSPALPVKAASLIK